MNPSHDSRIALHARSQEVARAVAYVRAGGPLGDVAPPAWMYEVEEIEAIHNASASIGDFDGLPVRRVARLPERDPRPFLVSAPT